MADSGAQAPTLGKYQLIAELGHGGMAEVFLALASGPAGFNKLVVIKQIRPQLGEDPEFLTMFLDEARLAARLNHPNVVQTNEVGDEDGRYFICMEYLEGQPFNRVLSRLVGKAAPGEGLTLAQQLRVLVEAMNGLHHAHELCDFDGTPLAVVHRDMSPHNIFVTYEGQVKVVDFGIAKALSSSTETRTGVLKGKVGYMAPEQALGEKVDRRADVFSCGMILWEILTGRRMFKGVADVAALQRIVNGDLPRPSTVVPDVDPRLEAICMKAISRHRADRHATAADFAADIEAVLDERGEKSSLRDIGKLVARAFDGERQKIKALVESTLAGTRTGLETTFDQRRTGSRPRPLPLIESAPTESVSMARELGHAPLSTGEPTTGTGRRSPSSLTANMTPTDQRVGAGRGRTLAFVALGVVAAGAVAAFALTRGREAPRTAASAVEAAPTLRTLRIESSPPGAKVSEGATVLGKTPLSLPLDPALGTRHLVVSLDGYLPYAVDQAPVHEDVRVLVPLAPTAAPPSTATATAAQSSEPSAKPKVTPPPLPRVTPPPPPPTTGPKPPPSDINMTR